MSRRPHNNHYHYAEQYSDGTYRRRVRRANVLHLPKRAIFFAVFMLLIFGVVTATFSYDTATETSEQSGGSLIVNVRNAKAAHDVFVETGARVDIAPSGWKFENDVYIYFDNTTTNWSDSCICLVIGKSSYSSVYQMSAVSNTNYYVVHLNNIGWSDATYMAIIGTGSLWGSGNWGSGNLTNATHRTAAYTSGLDATDEQRYVFTPANANNGCAINLSYKGTDNVSMNTISLKAKASYTVDGGTTYTEVNSTGGTVDITSYYFNSYNSITSSTPSAGADVSYSAAKSTNNSSFTASANTGYTFEGFYSDTFANNGSLLSSTSPYNYKTANGDKTVYGRFSANHYNITLVLTNGNGTSTAYGNASYKSGYTAPTGRYYTQSVTLPTAANVEADGREFGGWYTNSNCTGNAVTSISATQASDVTLYAKWTWSNYNIIYLPDDTDNPAAAAGTISNPNTNGVPTNDQKTHGADYTITSNTFNRPGYTQVGWATTANYTSTTTSGGTTYYAFGATYSTNAALTLYPVWQLNTPTKTDGYNIAPEIVSTGSMTVGSAPVSLNLTLYGGVGAAHSYNSDILRYYNYTITGPAGHDAEVGRDPSDPDTFMKFTADIPGSYTVKITVKDYSKTGVTNSYDNSITDSTDPRYHKGYAYSESNTATITVYPDAPTFSIEVYGKIDDPDRTGDSGSGNAYMVLLGNRYYFSATVDSTYLSNHPTTNYTYEWYWDDDFDPTHKVDTNNQNLTTITFVDDGTVSAPDYRLISYNSSHVYDPENGDPDPRMLAEESDGVYHSVSLYCRVTRNSVSNSSILKQKWYFIQPLIKSFEYEPMQKIFNINDQTVSLAAEYNVSDDPSYSTRLYFSHNNSNNANEWTLAEQDTGFIHSFANAIRTYLFPNGPKFFYMLMNGRNALGEEIESRSEKVHTTVGTVDSVADRTLYFDNSTAQSLKNYLVMCYYIDGSGSLCYQTAQDLYTYDDDPEHESTYDNNGVHYRVMIPSNAQAVRLGFLSSDVEGKFYYGSPTLSSGVIGGFTGPTYYGYSEQIQLTSSTGRIIFNSIIDGTLKEFCYSAP